MEPPRRRVITRQPVQDSPPHQAPSEPASNLPAAPPPLTRLQEEINFAEAALANDREFPQAPTHQASGAGSMHGANVCPTHQRMCVVDPDSGDHYAPEQCTCHRRYIEGPPDPHSSFPNAPRVYSTPNESPCQIPGHRRQQKVREWLNEPSRFPER